MSTIRALLLSLLLCPAIAFGQPVKVLVVGIRGVEAARDAWQPTIDHLNATLPQHRFSLLPVIPAELRHIESLVRDNAVDFVISQPAIYVDLEHDFGATRILTLVGEGGYSEFGSAIVVRADSDVKRLSDLRGRRVAGVARLGFGGWLVGYREMLAQGFDPYREAHVVYLGTQPRQLQALLDGEVDAAVVRTGMLEEFSRRQGHDIAQFRVLETKRHPGFDQLVSTPLYPEWALARVRGTPNELSKSVALALLAMPPGSMQARKAGYREWTVPYDYQPVHELLKTLRVEPYHDFGRIDLWQAMVQHAEGLAIVGALLAALYIVIINRNRKLQREIEVRTRTERALRDSRDQLRLAASVFSHAREAIMITDAGSVILDVNQAFSDITGYPREEVLGQTPRILKSGQQSPGFYRTMWDSLLHTGSWSGEIWNRRKDGSIYPEALAISSVRDDAGNPLHYIALFSDSTERKKAERALADSHQALQEEKRRAEELARSDPLTGLNNRRAFFELGRQIDENARRYLRSYSVIMLDLDHFKRLNDRHGHDTGDRALVTVAGIIGRVIRSSDVSARIGGEEFALILPETGLDEARQLAERLRQAFLETPFEHDGRAIGLSASLGVATFGDQARNLSQVLSHADQAMYRAKRRGRNRVAVYNETSEA